MRMRAFESETPRFDSLPFLSVPTRTVGYGMLAVVAAKKLDAFSTVFVVSHPELYEVIPFTRFFVETFGVVAGVTIASVLGIFAVFAAAEVSHRTCKGARSLLGAQPSPYPFIEYHVAYFLATALFFGAFVRNTMLLI